MLPKAKARGFTLIELLVVIAIIAILAAILFPVFAQARKQAYKAVGQSNAKQASLAILMYAQDYDEKFPRAGWGCQQHSDAGEIPDGAENQCGAFEWQNVTGPYTKSTGIYQNPGDGSAANFTWGTDLHSNDGHFSLLINDLLSHSMDTTASGFTNPYAESAPGTPGQHPYSDGLSLSAVNAPADCVLLMEGHCGWNKCKVSKAFAADLDTPALDGKTCRSSADGNGDPQSKFCKEQSVSGFQTQLFNSISYGGGGTVNGLPFYAGGGNVAFTDGHVKFTRYADQAGKPTLCSSLPWTKSIDPQQRQADNTGAYCDKNGPNPPAGGASGNWN